MIVRRLKFKTCKVVEVYWIFVGNSKNFMVSVFWVTLFMKKFISTMSHFKRFHHLVFLLQSVDIFESF